MTTTDKTTEVEATAPATTTTDASTTSTTPTTTTTTTDASTTPALKRKEKEKKEEKKPAYIETRTRKKARQALDFISGSNQRQASLFNLLGKDYTGPSEQQLEMIFRLFSKNGKIGSEELAAVLRSMGKRPLTKRIDKILYECDENGSGYIEMDEFIHYMQKKAYEKAKMLGVIESDSEDDQELTKKAATKKSTTTAAAAPEKTITKQPSFFQPLKKNSSIIQFYTENAGVHTANNVEVDQYSNPVGNNFDLGLEGAFSDFTILIGMFYTFNLKCEDSLKSKGFNIIVVKTQKEFIDQLSKADVAMIIPNKNGDITTSEADFLSAVKNYHEAGKGLFLWAENEPFFAQTNWVLNSLFDSKVVGSDPGQKNLSLGKGSETQKFASHLITSGIVTLFEGRTVSYFEKVPEKLEVIATSSGNNPIIACSLATQEKNCGRVIVDTGFTKLLDEFFNAGIERYVKNACVWLLALDHRFYLGVDTQSNIPAPVEVPTWQFKHGSWFNYDADASKVVEEAYQEWLLNPYIDIRSIKSGIWSYSVNFKENTQTNIQHHAHTTREIRRVLQKVVPQQ
ncbi:hypothetical protein CYY_008561 [Polysphondylium violaceum]|uniref:EF-hand domain-containing protein n=1 Tax=Polysphondylium violaceum TaxID=133409 RepID=A0A8J4PUZ7_9MYCE|nr:hypothetical protein CYY_008561 [Polysphondylium violaceum]